MAFTKTQIKALHEDALAALQAVAKKHGVAIRGGASVYGTTGKLGFEVLAIVEGAVETKEAAQFKAMAAMLGFQATDLGRDFTLAKDTYTLAGCNTAGRLVARAHRNGQMYILKNAIAVREALR